MKFFIRASIQLKKIEAVNEETNEPNLKTKPIINYKL